MKNNNIRFLFILFICFNTLLNAQSAAIAYKWGFGAISKDSHCAIDHAKVNGKKQVYFSGYTSEQTDFDMGPGTNTLDRCTFLVKYDEDKNLLWAKGLVGEFNININSVYLDGDSIVYLMGEFSNTFDADPSNSGFFPLTATSLPNSNFPTDVFLIKLGSDGDFIWAKSFGGLGSDGGADVCKDKDGNIYLTGHYEGTADVDPGPGVTNLVISGQGRGLYVSKLNAQGDFVWAFPLFTGGGFPQHFLFIKDDQLNVVGSFSGTVDLNPGAGVNTIRDDRGSIFFAQYDLNATYINSQYFHSESGNMNIYDLEFKNNHIFFTGVYSRDIHFLNPDTTKNVLTGEVGTYTNGFVIRMDNNFKIEQTISIKTPAWHSNNSIYFHGVDADDLNNIYVVGTCNAVYDMDPTANEFNIDPGAIIAKYDKNGYLVSAFSLKANTNAWDVAVTRSNTFYISGTFAGMIDLDPGPGIYTISTTDWNSNGFMAKYGVCEQKYSIYKEICQGQTYSFAGKQLNETGSYTHTFPTSGCDSVITLNLKVKHLNTTLTVDGSAIRSQETSPAAFQWFNCSTQSTITGATTKSFSPTDNYDYAVSITKDGCTDTTECQNIFANANAGIPALSWANKVDKSQWGNTKFMKTDQYGNFYITGGFYETMNLDLKGGTFSLTSSGSSPDLFLAKYNNNGILQWAFSLGTQGLNGASEYGDCLYIDKQGNTYLTGTFQRTMDFDPGPEVVSLSTSSGTALFFASYNSIGQLRWAKMIEGNGSVVKPVSLVLDNNLEILLTGSFSNAFDANPDPGVYTLQMPEGSSIDLYAGFVARYSNSGNFISAYALGRNEGGLGKGPVAAVDKNNNVIITGIFSQEFDFDLKTGVKKINATEDIYLVKYTSAMDLVWVIRIGEDSDEHINNVLVDDANTIYLRGATVGSVDLSGGLGTGITSRNGEFIAKYNENGVFQLQYPFYTLGNPSANVDLALDKAGNLFIAGEYFFEFDPGNGKIISLGGEDGLVAKYSSNGSLLWAFTLAEKNEQAVQNIALDNEGNFFIAGTFSNTVDFDPRLSNYPLSTSPATMSFIAKYGQDCAPIDILGSVKGNTIELKAKNSLYTWIDCNTSKVVATTISNQYTPTVAGTYKAIIYQGDCMDSTTCYPVIPTGIKNEDTTVWSIHPNPATTQLTIHVDAMSEIQNIQVMDVTGKSVRGEIISTDAHNSMLSITDLAEGVYFVSVLLKNNTILHSRFIKQ